MSKLVTFPGLGLEFELNPVACSPFGWNIYWYGIIIACGFLLAVLYGFTHAKRFGVDVDKLTDAIFFVVPAAIIGARLYYVIFNFSIYVDPDGSFNLGRAVAIWDGGLAIYGGVIATVISAVIYCKVRKMDFWSGMDVTSYGLLIGQLVGRWGNFVNVECYGGVTDLPWRMCSESIANELWSKGLLESEAAYQSILDGTLGVHPTFLYESLWNLLGFILLVIVGRKLRKFNGQIFLGYVAWYGLGRAVIEGMRTDSLYFFGTGIRTSQMLGIVSAVAAVIWMVVRARTAGPASPPIVDAPKGEAASGEAAEVPAQAADTPSEESAPVEAADTPSEEAAPMEVADAPSEEAGAPAEDGPDSDAEAQGERKPE